MPDVGDKGGAAARAELVVADLLSVVVQAEQLVEGGARYIDGGEGALMSVKPWVAPALST